MNFSTSSSTTVSGAWLFPNVRDAQSRRMGDVLSHDSRYLAPTNGVPCYRTSPSKAVAAHDRTAFDRLRAHVSDVNYPCVMARSVFNRESFRMSTYGRLGEPGNAEMLCHDLCQFSSEFPAPVSAAVSFLAWFDGPTAADEASFERQLWSQLQALPRQRGVDDSSQGHALVDCPAP